MKEIEIPDFMQDYYHNSDTSGQRQIKELAEKYQIERATFLQTTYLKKLDFQREWNAATFQKKILTAEEATAPMKATYQKAAKQIYTDRLLENEQQLGSVRLKQEAKPAVQETPVQPKMREPEQMLFAFEKKAQLREKFLENLQAISNRQTVKHIPKS